MKKVNKKFKVYVYTNNINNKKYVGITSRPLSYRSGSDGRNYKQCVLFWNAIQKHGWNNFNVEVVYENLDEEEAKQHEIELISELKTTDPKFGYNISHGGDSGTDPIVQYTGKDQRFIGMYLLDVCRELNLDFKLVYSRIYRGWDIDEALEINEHQNAHTINIYYGNNEKYNNRPIQEICEELGILYNTYITRKKRGWSDDEALEFVKRPPKQPSSTPFIYQGSNPEYFGLAMTDLCRQFGLDYRNVFRRVTMLKWSYDEALELVPCAKMRKPLIQYDGIFEEYKGKTIKELCEKLNLKYSTVYARIKLKEWSHDEALELVERTKTKKSNKT